MAFERRSRSGDAAQRRSLSAAARAEPKAAEKKIGFSREAVLENAFPHSGFDTHRALKTRVIPIKCACTVWQVMRVPRRVIHLVRKPRSAAHFASFHIKTSLSHAMVPSAPPCIAVSWRPASSKTVYRSHVGGAAQSAGLVGVVSAQTRAIVGKGFCGARCDVCDGGERPWHMASESVHMAA